MRELASTEPAKGIIRDVPADAREVMIPVEGMTCLSCEATIERSLMELDGVYLADAKHEERSVIVRYDEEKISRGVMERAIERAGYRVEHLDR